MWLLLFCFLQLGWAIPIPDCRAGTVASVAPDLTARCDRTVSCDYCQRNALSWDFLCCEDNFGWVAAHAVTPMLVTLYFQDIRWTLIYIIWFEPFEQLYTSMMNDGTNLETLFGSEVGDAVLQGGTGLWMGIMLLYIFDLPLLVSTGYRARRHEKRWKRFKYFAFAFANIGLIFLVAWHKPDGTANYGLWVNAACQAVIWFVLYPWILYTDKENDLVWNAELESNPYPKHLRNWFFYIVGVIIIAIEMSTGGWEYMANDWFQVWCTEAGIVTVLSVVACVIAYKRRDWKMFGIFCGIYGVALSFALYITSKVILNNAYAWAALGVLLAAVVSLLLIVIFLRRRLPYNINYSRRLEFPTLQSLASRKQNFD